MRSGKRRGENERAEKMGHIMQGKEFWSRRPGTDKKTTHRMERRRAKILTQRFT